MPFSAPQTPQFEELPLDQIAAEPVRRGYLYWAGLRGGRPYPSRKDFKPSAIRDLLRHLVLIKVIDGARDFHMSVVGDEVQRAYDVVLNNRLLSEIVQADPTVFPGWLERYRRSAVSGEPHFYRLTAGLDGGATKFIHREAVVMPLGEAGRVTHIVTFGKHELKSAD